VAKKKDAVALFEVISKTRQKRSEAGLGVPRWMSSQADDSAQQPSAPPAASQAVSAPSAAPAREPARPRQAPRTAPMIAPEGNRLKFSLSYYVCVGVLAGAVVLLALAFWLGYIAGSPDAGNGAQQAKLGGQIPVPPGSTGGNGGGPTQGTPTGRIAGKYYLIIQRLKGDTEADKAEADRIVSFCAEHGEPASVWEMPIGSHGGKRYFVWSLRPFDAPDDPKGLEHAGRVEEWGREYFARHSTYEFLQRTGRDAPFDPTFRRCSEENARAELQMHPKAE